MTPALFTTDMLDFTRQKADCTGCTACMAACPVACITMEKDDEGFLYPSKDERCIHCGLCEKVCPIQQKLSEKYKHRIVRQQAYLCAAKDYDVWRRSASGGAFSCICQNWGDEDTYIYGAIWEGTLLYHKEILGAGNIALLCKSKYVASDLRDTFSLVLKRLKQGRRVIFCGTPCQVAGLRSIIPQAKKSNALLIDLICHGNGSMDVFQECLHAISVQAGSEVVSYAFREKRKHYETDHIGSILTQDGRKRYIVNDQYMQLFLSQNCLRPCCGEHCQFRDGNRPGDITLADGKGLRFIFPKLLAGRRNYSTVVANTPVGEEAISGLERLMDIHPYDLAEVKKYNPLFSAQTWFSKDRDNFFADFEANPQKAVRDWTQPFEDYKPSPKKVIFNLLPRAVRELVSTHI